MVNQLNFLNVTLRNFLSCGNVTQFVRLNVNGLTLILGANGNGKTSLLQAISYGLFGEPLTNVKLDNLINSINQKGMMVTIEFEVDGTLYRIERGRKPNIFKFYKGNKPIESDSLGENKHTQEEINRLIGMNHTLFCHIVAMNTYTIPFLKMKPADQREVIEQLLGILTLSERDEKLVEIIKETKRLLKDEESMIRAVSDSNARIQVAIDKGANESHSWQVAWKATMTRLRAALEDLSGVDFDAELARFDEIDAFNEEFAAISATVKEEQKETIALRRELDRMVETKADLERALSKVPTNHIDRLKAEMARCEAEAEKGCEAEVKKLQDQIARCRREADRTHDTRDTEIAKIEAQIVRRRADAAKKTAASEEKMVELSAIIAEMENTDGHTCSTCGQDINGTAHLEKIVANLQRKSEVMKKAIEKDVVESLALEEESNDLLTDIEKVKAEHLKSEQNWLVEVQKIENELEEVGEKYLAIQESWRDKADAVRTEITTAETEVAERKSSIQEQIDSLFAKITETYETVSERDTMERVYQEELESMKLSAPKPITYSSREEVWKAREKFNALEADYLREGEKVNPHETYVASLKATLQPINYDDLNRYQDDLKHQEFIHKLLTAKDSFIRKKIIDRNLYLLNSKLSNYLIALGLPHEAKFKPDLTVEITHMGRDFDFEQLSRGEMNLVILALCWSFRYIWEDLNKNMNLVFTDELLDSGLDPQAARSALNALEKMAQQKKNVFLISHKEELIGQVDHILTVHKEDGFTRFEVDAS